MLLVCGRLHKLSEYLLDRALRQRDKPRIRLQIVRDDQDGLVECVAACAVTRAVVAVERTTYRCSSAFAQHTPHGYPARHPVPATGSRPRQGRPPSLAL